ncbi:MAG: stage VI sporulation protein F [Anaeroplasma sp.]|nr:stage VI sporulation protein F [Anaeroplasma sp.]
MDFSKLIDIISKTNISSDKIQELILMASKMDLSNEDNQRILIREGAKVAKKEMTPELEDKMIDLIREKGISNELFKYVRN